MSWPVFVLWRILRLDMAMLCVIVFTCMITVSIDAAEPSGDHTRDVFHTALSLYWCRPMRTCLCPTVLTKTVITVLLSFRRGDWWTVCNTHAPGVIRAKKYEWRSLMRCQDPREQANKDFQWESIQTRWIVWKVHLERIITDYYSHVVYNLYQGLWERMDGESQKLV